MIKKCRFYIECDSCGNGFQVGEDWAETQNWVEKTYKKEVIILQCMVYGQNEFFIEYVFKEDLTNDENERKNGI